MKYVECQKCLLSTIDTQQISFNEKGVCNYCEYYDEIYAQYVTPKEERKEKIESLVSDIKIKSKGKKYDCIIGVSGGVDSTYVAYYVKKVLGLNPLAVHLDYGWNSELAVMNITKILQKLDIDLYTYVIDWEEVKDLQLSFFKASVVDIELVNDFAISATMYNVAYKHGVKYILHGGNIQTEGGKLPVGWTWSKYDQLNLTSIHKLFGKVKLKTYPKFSFWKHFYLKAVYKMNFIGILNYIEYNRDDVKRFIIEELGWQDYGGKHFESIFTRFYQGYILPEKFNIKKQKFHLSVLICSGQLTKEQAKKELEQEYYLKEQYTLDKEFLLKKLNITDQEFNQFMELPIKRHDDYPSYTTRHYVYHERFFKFISPILSKVKFFFK